MSIHAGTDRRVLRVGGLTALILAIVVLGSWSALADHVEPSLQTDNPTCGDFDDSWTELKVEPVGDGEYTAGTLTVTISVDEDAKTFDWSSNIGIDAVFAKGGPNGNLYSYDPEETADTGLHAPLNDPSPEEGDFYGLSHISFCYDAEGTPSPSPSETPSGSPTPSPSVSPSQTPTQSPSPSETTPGTSVVPTTVQTSPKVLGTKVLSSTGADVRDLAVMAFGLVALGVLAYTVASRAGKPR